MVNKDTPQIMNNLQSSSIGFITFNYKVHVPDTNSLVILTASV